jgi:hypothetical protein
VAGDEGCVGDGGGARFQHFDSIGTGALLNWRLSY